MTGHEHGAPSPTRQQTTECKMQIFKRLDTFTQCSQCRSCRGPLIKSCAGVASHPRMFSPKQHSQHQQEQGSLRNGWDGLLACCVQPRPAEPGCPSSMWRPKPSQAMPADLCTTDACVKGWGSGHQRDCWGGQRGAGRPVHSKRMREWKRRGAGKGGPAGIRGVDRGMKGLQADLCTSCAFSNNIC